MVDMSSWKNMETYFEAVKRTFIFFLANKYALPAYLRRRVEKPDRLTSVRSWLLHIWEHLGKQVNPFNPSSRSAKYIQTCRSSDCACCSVCAYARASVRTYISSLARISLVPISRKIKDFHYYSNHTYRLVQKIYMEYIGANVEVGSKPKGYVTTTHMETTKPTSFFGQDKYMF